MIAVTGEDPFVAARAAAEEAQAEAEEAGTGQGVQFVRRSYEQKCDSIFYGFVVAVKCFTAAVILVMSFCSRHLLTARAALQCPMPIRFLHLSRPERFVSHVHGVSSSPT